MPRPKRMYRGIKTENPYYTGGNGHGSQYSISGLYMTCDKSFARKYGDLFEVENGYPKNPIKYQYWFQFETFIHDCKAKGLDPKKELIRQGYDGVDCAKGYEVIAFGPFENIRFIQVNKRRKYGNE